MLGFAASALCESHTIPGLENLGMSMSVMVPEASRILQALNSEFGRGRELLSIAGRIEQPWPH